MSVFAQLQIQNSPGEANAWIQVASQFHPQGLQPYVMT